LLENAKAEFRNGFGFLLDPEVEQGVWLEGNSVWKRHFFERK
jgi:hypothetical protein